MQTRSIYLSAVGAEFQSYVDELTGNLSQRGFLVKSRSNFAGDANVLERVEEYIRTCDVVICLVGNQFGEEPPEEEAAAFADLSRERHSYAQWEYLFGSHIGKALYAFLPTDDLPRDCRNEEPGELATLQDQFRETRVESGIIGTPIEFGSLIDLRVEALVLKELTPETVEPQIARQLNLENPYIGFRKFMEADKGRFFGRKKLIANIAKQIGEGPLLTVFGAVGSGKSSVVRAGVIPKFREQYPDGKVAAFQPGRDPFGKFAKALEQAGFPENVVSAAAEGSPRVFQKVRDVAGSAKEPWLIFIDQFEEIFTRTEAKDSATVFEFVSSIINLASMRQTVPMRVVLAIRDDFIGRLSEFQGLPELTDQNMIRVSRPGWEEMCEIIELPAAAHGVRYEPGLVSRIVSHVEGEGQNLPMLQYSLYRLWEVEKADMSQFTEGIEIDEDDKESGGLHDRRINRISYKALSGVPNALRTRVDELFGDLSPKQRGSLRKVLLYLVGVSKSDTGGFTPVTRPVPKVELFKDCGVDSVSYVKILLEEGFLLEDKSGNVELAHDALFTGWQDLANWVNDLRDAVELKQALRFDAKNWQAKVEENEVSFTDLWGGAKLNRALELNKRDEDTGRSDFDRVGGLSDLEDDFLEASGDQFVKETRRNLSDSADEWKANGKSKDLLWTGPRLNRALELNEVQAGEEQSGFQRVGGLDKPERKFLAASEKNSCRKPVFTRFLLFLTFIGLLVFLFTTLDDQFLEWAKMQIETRLGGN